VRNRYVLCNEDTRFYDGFTSDLEKRLDQHNRGQSNYTRGHSWRLIYCEAYLDKSDAKRRETMLKQGGQAVGHLKNRISGSTSVGCAELSAGLKAPSRREGR
jgi:putative endonuclease